MKTVKTKFGYADDTSRVYSFDVEDSLSAGVKPKILGINESLAAGTAGGLSSFFVSDSGANFLKITEASIEEEIKTALDITGA